MSPTIKIVVAAAVALVLGTVIGFVAGRTTLEQKWSQPYATITPADETRSKVADADPTPASGTRILKAMPIRKARAALAAMTAKDLAVATTGAVGADDDGMELHVTVENRGTCKITSASGVAYGFGPRGLPAKLNKSGEYYVAFKLDAPIEPGKKAVTDQKVHFGDDATLAIAHVDHTECEGKPAWTRQ